MIQANYENVIVKMKDHISQLTFDKIVTESALEDLQAQHAQLAADNAQLREDLNAQLELHATAPLDEAEVGAALEEAQQPIPDTFKGKSAAKK